MSISSIASGLAGGIGLFLLGMWLMTDGLKLAAGPALERVLARSTDTRLKGLVAGILITAIVQSSTAVTVAAIGFVNAGLLSLGNALWVLFGANLGTTMTGWLVALVGLSFKIETLALPMVGLGMVLHFTGEGRRRGAVGLAIAGFGVLFLGIDTMKTTFTDLGGQVSLPEGQGLAGVVAHVGVGVLLTVLMQSSSAALAVALTSAQGGLIGMSDVAAVVVGANIGTTVTAILAALNATANAKRAAAAHVLFNLMTGAVAILLLPWMLATIEHLRMLLDLDAAPAVTLALFHTAFNGLGILLIWPMAGRLAVFLGRRFRTADADESRPHYLDDTVLNFPALALDALEAEVRRSGEIALRAGRRVLKPEGGDSGKFSDPVVVARLNDAIAHFVTRLNRVSMEAESAQRLPRILRIARYYTSVAELAGEIASMPDMSPLPDKELAERMDQFVKRVAGSWFEADTQTPKATDATLTGQDFSEQYQSFKAALLDAGARGDLSVSDMERGLRRLSRIRRMTEQAMKAAASLRALKADLPDSVGAP